MAHRVEREREREREQGRDQGRDRDRDRLPRGENRDRREPVRDRNREPSGLNEFFVDGEGIHRDVMQREICKYLGPEAYSRPGTYNGQSGYIVTAVRPFTPRMIDDLQSLSEDWVSENRDLYERGQRGSPMRSSPVAGLPNEPSGIPYPQSQASRRSDRSDRSDITLPSSQDTFIDPRYPQQPYTSAPVPAGFTPTSSYPQASNYPASQVPGYPTAQNYPQQPGYPPNTSFPTGTTYQSGPIYPTASGYPSPSYPAPVGRPGNPSEQNYIYDTGEYPNQGYPYRQQGAYPNGQQPRDPRVGSDPRSAPGYPFVTSPQDAAMRGATVEERYAYGPMAPGQAGRGGFPAPARGPPTAYDPPQPRDGFNDRDSERRRR